MRSCVGNHGCVERLDDAYVPDGRCNAMLGEPGGGLLGRFYELANSEDADIGASGDEPRR